MQDNPTMEEQDDDFLIELFASFASRKVQEYERRQEPPITTLQLDFKDGEVPTGFQDGGLTGLRDLTIGDMTDSQYEVSDPSSPGYDPKKVFTEALGDAAEHSNGIDTGVNTVEGTLNALASLAIDVATKTPGPLNAIGRLSGLITPVDTTELDRKAKLNYYSSEPAAEAAAVTETEETQSGGAEVGVDAQAAADSDANAAAAEESVSATEGPSSASVNAGADAATGSADDAGADADGPGPGPSDGDDGAEGVGAKHGGVIKGYQEGDLVEADQADTQLDALGLGPIGLVNDPDGTTGVADDLDMELPVGSYVVNEDAATLTGLGSINKLIKEAIDLALEDEVDLPVEIKTAEKIPIRISKGEIVIPAPLVDYIGLKKLENMNNRGLKVRKQREAESAPVETAAAPSPQEDLLAQLRTVA